mmetsp:Transcript_57966/g.164709  ORF Transcript_57966/g.164709 Transcript_57966/m.164709 type:complete len:381 (+) Transcript_57966:215-1357(+)
MLSMSPDLDEHVSFSTPTRNSSRFRKPLSLTSNCRKTASACPGVTPRRLHKAGLCLRPISKSCIVTNWPSPSLLLASMAKVSFSLLQDSFPRRSWWRLTATASRFAASSREETKAPVTRPSMQMRLGRTKSTAMAPASTASGSLGRRAGRRTSGPQRAPRTKTRLMRSVLEDTDPGVPGTPTSTMASVQAKSSARTTTQATLRKASPNASAKTRNGRTKRSSPSMRSAFRLRSARQARSAETELSGPAELSAASSQVSRPASPTTSRSASSQPSRHGHTGLPRTRMVTSAAKTAANSWSSIARGTLSPGASPRATALASISTCTMMTTTLAATRRPEPHWKIALSTTRLQQARRVPVLPRLSDESTWTPVDTPGRAQCRP